MRGNSCHCASFGGHRLSAVLFVFLLTVGYTHGVLKGDPPSFPTPTEPQDQFVRSDAGNLTFLCPVVNVHPSNITWYRGGVVDNQFRQEDGSYFVPNINPSDGTYASADGVEYYCTASNDFGTIRSRNATASIAHFAGFEEDRPTSDVVAVIVSITNMRQWVSLECAINPGSFPNPIIEWVTHADSDPEGVVMVVEEDEPNIVRFVDNGRYLILETTSEAITDKAYYCRVTNPEFTAGNAPTTYTFNIVESFNQTVYPPNGVKVYKQLTNKTAPRDGDYDVVFGTPAAYGGRLLYTWLFNGDQGVIRAFGAIGILTLSDLDENIEPLIKVEVILSQPTNQELVAYLHLLDPAVIDKPPDNVTDALTGDLQTFTCSVSGNPPPKLKWYFNGAMIEGDMDGQSLTISSPVEEDSGMYQCFAENESGTVFASWTLQVRDPVAPKVTSSYTDIPSDVCLDYHFIQQDSGPVLLVVNVTADPCPQVSWSRRAPGDTVATEVTAGTSGITITDGCKDYTLGDTKFTFQLKVDDIEGDDAAGFYSVSFTNAGGSTAVEETFVTPFVRARITNFSPVPNLGNCLAAGSEVDIVCENIGFPVGRVEFVKDGSSVDFSTERVTQTCDRLHISEVNVNDTGSYICMVHNRVTDPQPESTSNPLNLMYCIVPQIVGDITFTKNTPEEGERTAVTCRWTGQPEPTVTWFKDGERLVEADFDRIRIVDLAMGRELQIEDVKLSDTGNYVCNVSNAAGFDSRTTRLEVQEKDEPPLPEAVIIGISGGFGGTIVLIAIVVVLLCCVYQCARQSTGEYVVPSNKNNFPMSTMEPQYNVDAPDGLEEEPEAFNPDYASLPAIRPAQPPQYRPTPHYPTADYTPGEFQKMPPSDEDFVGPYPDNGGMYPPTVDDFVSEDAQFV